MFAGDLSGGSDREPRFGHAIRPNVNLGVVRELECEPEIEWDVGRGLLVRIDPAEELGFSLKPS
jgi:hypothetical protein